MCYRRQRHGTIGTDILDTGILWLLTLKQLRRQICHRQFWQQRMCHLDTCYIRPRHGTDANDTAQLAPLGQTPKTQHNWRNAAAPVPIVPRPWRLCHCANCAVRLASLPIVPIVPGPWLLCQLCQLCRGLGVCGNYANCAVTLASVAIVPIVPCF